MYYNKFDFDYALESMDSVDLTAQANRLADYGDEAFADVVLEAYEDIYTALEAGDLEEALDIYAALEEAEEEVEEDPDVARKAKRKALLKKVGKGAIGVAALGHVVRGGIKGARIGNELKGSYSLTGDKANLLTDEQMKKIHRNGGAIAGGLVSASHVGAAYGAYHLGKSIYNKKKARDKVAELEDDVQEGYEYFNH